MQKGYIPAYNFPLMWIPEGSSVPYTIFGKPKGAIRLTSTPFMSVPKAESYYCDACELIITPVKK